MSHEAVHNRQDKDVLRSNEKEMVPVQLEWSLVGLAKWSLFLQAAISVTLLLGSGVHEGG